VSWVRIDDTAPEHRKLLAAGADAAWLWVSGLAYCNRSTSRVGVIPFAKVSTLYPMKHWKKAAAKLVEVGLWEEAEDGYRIHDYHEYQPTADARAARAAAGQKGGRRSGESRRSKAEANASSDSWPVPPDPTDLSEAFASTLLEPRPVPIRPDQKQELLSPVCARVISLGQELHAPELDDERKHAASCVRVWNELPGVSPLHNLEAAEVLAQAIREVRGALEEASKPCPDDRAILAGLARRIAPMVRDGLSMAKPSTLAKFVGDAVLVAQGELDPEAKPQARAHTAMPRGPLQVQTTPFSGKFTREA